MDSIVAVTQGVISVASAAVGVSLALGIVAMVIEEQVLSLGSPRARAELLYRLSALSACVALIIFVNVIASDVAALIGGELDAGGMRGAIIRIATYFVDIGIGLVVVVSVAMVALGFFDAQIEAVLGNAEALSLALARLGTAVILLLIGVMAVPIANLVVTALMPGA